MGLWDIFLPWISTAASAVVVVATAIVYGPFWFQYLRLKFKGNMPPLPPGCIGLPYWGESLDYLKSWSDPHNPDVWYDKRKAKHGGIFRTHILGSPTVVMLGPAANKFILINENKLFGNSWPESVKILIGVHAMVTSQGADHKRMRRVIHSFLGQENLMNAVARFERIVVNHLDSVYHGGEIIRAYDKMKDMALTVAADFFLGLKPGEELESFSGHFHDFSAGILSHPLDLPWTAFGKAKRARVSMLAQIRSQIRLYRSKNAGEEGNFLDMVLSVREEGGGELRLSEEEIADNLMGLLIGGHDTTPSALATILKHLSLSPHILRRLRKDCERVRESKKAGEALTWSDIKSLEYMHNVIAEGLRIVAPINGGFKQAKTDVVYGGYTIPKGWKVHYSMRQTNNKEEYFKSPERFDPDRFNKRHEPFSFIPFGQGNRICPGNEFAKLEMEMFLYHLVLRFDWDLVEVDERINMYFIPYPMHGLPILLKPASPFITT